MIVSGAQSGYFNPEITDKHAVAFPKDVTVKKMSLATLENGKHLWIGDRSVYLMQQPRAFEKLSHLQANQRYEIKSRHNAQLIAVLEPSNIHVHVDFGVISGVVRPVAISKEPWDPERWVQITEGQDVELTAQHYIRMSTGSVLTNKLAVKSDTKISMCATLAQFADNDLTKATITLSHPVSLMFHEDRIVIRNERGVEGVVVGPKCTKDCGMHELSSAYNSLTT